MRTKESAVRGKEIVLIGGPNGAGKTMLARVPLPQFLKRNEYLNASKIARRAHVRHA